MIILPELLAADPAGKANYEFARREKFILKEDRMFLKLASGPHAPRLDPEKLQTEIMSGEKGKV